MQPGQTIAPGGNPETPPTWQYNPSSAPQPDQLPQPTPPQTVDQTPQPQPVQPIATEDNSSVRWTASEFIAHSKNGGWYGLLALATLLVAAAVFFLTKDIVSTAVIGIVAIIFGISAARKPRELQYQVDNDGVHIADKTYAYNSFKSFSVVQEEGVESIWFAPLKRFMPMVSIYFEPNDGDKIVDILTQFLPFEDRELDPVDRLMHRLRF